MTSLINKRVVVNNLDTIRSKKKTKRSLNFSNENVDFIVGGTCYVQFKKKEVFVVLDLCKQLILVIPQTVSLELFSIKRFSKRHIYQKKFPL